MSKVFVSYAQVDSPFARKLAADLRHRDLSVWSADHELKPGERWARVVDEAIRKSEYVLVVLSDKSGSSSWIRTEIALALSQEKRIIPIFTTNHPDVPYILTAIQGLDFSDTKGYASSIEELAGLLSKSEEYRASHEKADLDVRVTKARLDELMLQHENLVLQRSRRIKKRFLTVNVAVMSSIVAVTSSIVIVGWQSSFLAEMVPKWRQLAAFFVGSVAGVVATNALWGLISRWRRRTGGD